jgi:hypothetical protein
MRMPASKTIDLPTALYSSPVASPILIKLKVEFGIKTESSHCGRRTLTRIMILTTKQPSIRDREKQFEGVIPANLTLADYVPRGGW